MRKGFLLFVAAVASSASARILPETQVFIQTQLYPHREQSRGFLGKYVTQPLYVLQELPEDPNRDGIPEFPHWGTFSSQADYDTTLSLVRQYGVDGIALFVDSRPKRFFTAGADCPVPDVKVAPMIIFWDKNVSNEFARIRTVLSNPRAPKVGEKFLCMTYGSGRNTPEELAAKIAAVKREFGDRFVFFAESSQITDNGGALHQNGGVLPERNVRRMKDLARRYLRAADGIQVSSVGFVGVMDHGERVFDTVFYRAMLKVLREVLDEPEFRGKKYLSSGAGLGHMNAYRVGHSLAEDGTRTLRASMETSLEAEPDFILMPEWDELNENTCLCPTLYGARTTMRIMRYYMAQIKRRPLEPMPGDDASVPNLVVSYRKSLDPGERLNVEVLNVPDGTRRGKLEAAVELLDENNAVLCSFQPRTLDEETLDEVRFEAGTAALPGAPRAVRVRLVLSKDGRPLATYLDGFHPVDLQPGGSFNHICAKQPLRDLAPSAKVVAGYRNGRFAAKVSCAEPIRYAMVCGNGWIQYVKGKTDSPVNRFREDSEHAVFSIDIFQLSNRMRRKEPLKFRLEGVSEANWRYWHTYRDGTDYDLDFICDGAGPTLYLRIPKSDLAAAHLTLDCGAAFHERLALKKVFDLGAFSVGRGGESLQVTLARFGLQAGYPHALDDGRCELVVPVVADRPSMMYHLQFVTMSGRTWFSRPFVVEPPTAAVPVRVFDCAAERMTDLKLPASRVPTMAWDFSPDAGNVLRTTDGYRHWWGFLGGAQSSASLWNRGKKQEGVFDHSAISGEPVPARRQEADGTWSLVFDGKDDFASFPVGTISSYAASTISLRVFPERTDVEETILSTRGSVQYLTNGPDGVMVGTAEMEDFRRTMHKTGLKLIPGQWNQIVLRLDGETLTVSVNGRRHQVEMKFPGCFVAPVALGASWDLKRGRFKGRLADFSISP